MKIDLWYAVAMKLKVTTINHSEIFFESEYTKWANEDGNLVIAEADENQKTIGWLGEFARGSWASVVVFDDPCVY